MDKSFRHFLWAAALCSFLGALTTILLIFLPSAEIGGFQHSILLHDNSVYTSKLWILFLHPQFNFIASLGVAVVLLKKYPLEIIIGTFFLLVWTYTEMSQQVLLIDALNQYWRPGYLSASDSMSRDIFLTLIKGTGAISDSQYFLLLYGFGLGTLLYGLAFIRENNWAKFIGIALVFIGVLSLCSFARYYLGLNELSEAVDWMYQWVYSFLQPLVRLAIAVWLIGSIRPLTLKESVR
ncbi:MAG: hypothetical protein GKR93_02170 [Gammaproteobacteria bacterium]|nr:hypothetical protein [Gammaproteobacteria bacterium]